MSREPEPLQESENHLKELIDQSPIGLVLHRMDGTLVAANPAYSNIIGYTHDELVQLSYGDINSEKFVDLDIQQFEQLKDMGRLGPFEKEYRHKDGHLVPVKINAIVLTRNGENYIWASVENITVLKERNRLEEQLLQSKKMEALGTLAGGIAHDFNNILAAIMGNTDLLIHDPSCHPNSRDRLENILAAVIRAKKLVRQILIFCRMEKEERVYFKIETIVEESIQLLQNTIPKSINMNLTIPSDVGTVFADPTQIQQIIMNLCTNAYQAMPMEIGDIEVCLSKIYLDDFEVKQYPGLRPGNYALLRISDTGIGMNPEILGRIYEPFYTTKQKGQGTGMGLSVVLGIIQSHEGSISAESYVGEGTTFKVLLPLVNPRTNTDPFEEKVSLRGGHERILFVDDETMLVGLGKAILENLGYNVTAFDSSIKALQHFEASPKGFDLIITDQTMPEMTGDVLARKALMIRPGIPIIICTGYSSHLDHNQAKAIGVQALLMKPIKYDFFAKEIRRVLDGKPPREKSSAENRRIDAGAR